MAETNSWTAETFDIHGLLPSTEPFAEVYMAAIDARDRDRVDENFRVALAGSQKAYTSEFRINHPRLGERSIFEHGIIERDQDGRAIRAYGFLQDVTELRLMEADLRQGRERLELTLAGADLGSWDWSPATKKAYYELHGGVLDFKSQPGHAARRRPSASRPRASAARPRCPPSRRGRTRPRPASRKSAPCAECDLVPAVRSPNPQEKAIGVFRTRP